MIRTKLLATAAFAALASLSLAQQGMRGMQGMMRMFQSGPTQSLMMLRRDDVREEIKLNDDQKGKLDALQAGARERFQSVGSEMRAAFMNGGDETAMKAVQDKMQAILDALAKEALGILDDGQKKRVRELVVQSQGPLGILQPEMAKEIVLTPAQKAQIDDLQNRQMEANRNLWEQAQNGEIDREDVGKNMEKNRTILDAAILKILTEAQRAKFKELSGPAFAFKDPKPGTPGAWGRPGGGL